MNILRLALRNVFRNRRRTFITLLSINAAACAIIVFGGFISFSFEGLRESTIRTDLGHFQVAKRGYFAQGAGLPVNYLLPNVESIENQLHAIDHVKAVTRRLSGAGLISTGERTLSARIIGVMPDREEDFSAFETIIKGTQLDGDFPEGCVIGSGLAKSLGTDIGAGVTLLSTTLNGVINAVDCTVVGIARTASKEYDNVYVKLPLPLLQRLLDTKQVERLLVLLDDTKNVPLVEYQLADLVKLSADDLEYRNWSDLAEFYKGVVNLYSAIFNLTAIILTVVVFLGITNTLGMSVFERFREIGTLRAIGETRSGVMRLFLAEGVLIGIIGGAMGLLVGAGTAWLINISGGISVPPPPGMSVGYIAYIVVDPRALAYAFLVAFVASTTSAVYPAVVAARIDIVRALNHV